MAVRAACCGRQGAADGGGAALPTVPVAWNCGGVGGAVIGGMEEGTGDALFDKDANGGLQAAAALAGAGAAAKRQPRGVLSEA